jgi:hypothetical protein
VTAPGIICALPGNPIKRIPALNKSVRKVFIILLGEFIPLNGKYYCRPPLLDPPEDDDLEPELPPEEDLLPDE